jgi:hypothetical protein
MKNLFFIIVLFIGYSSNLYAKEVIMYCDRANDKSKAPRAYKLVDDKYVLIYEPNDGVWNLLNNKQKYVETYIIDEALYFYQSHEGIHVENIIDFRMYKFFTKIYSTNPDVPMTVRTSTHKCYKKKY